MGDTLVTGVDLVYLPRFKEALKKGGQQFLHRVFHEGELTNKEVPHLAGIFAAKEAIIKALSLPVDSFHDIKVINKPSGGPTIEIRSTKLADEIRNCSVSISHDGDYVVAQFVALVKI